MHDYRAMHISERKNSRDRLLPAPPVPNLLPFIPSGNVTPSVNCAPACLSTSSFSERLNDNKTSGRVDGEARFGRLSGYYYFDNYTLSSPYWPAPAPLLPGFNVLGRGRNHLISLADTKTFGTSIVNEFRLQS